MKSKAMSKIVLPKNDDNGKPIFSYTQYSKWKKDKKDYFRSYMFGERFEGNAYTDFGTLVGEALETGDFSPFEPFEQETLKKVTRLDEFERQIYLDLGEFGLIGFIDTNDLVRGRVKRIIDYKTGALNKEAVYDAEDYNQVTIYAAALEQETGHLPKEGWVELIERTGNPWKGQDLMVGKEVVKVTQDVSKEAVEAVKQDIISVAKDVSAFYKVFQKLNETKV
jgi:hypothetical protein